MTLIGLQGSNTNLGQALQFLREYDKEASEMCFRVRSAQWNYSTNMTDYNKRKMIDEQTHKAKFDKLSWKRAIAFDWTSLQDSMARRQLKFLVTSGRASLSDEKYNEVPTLIKVFIFKALSLLKQSNELRIVWHLLYSNL